MSNLSQRILIVEDEAPMCELLTSFFTEKGYEIDTVQDGEHALARLEERDYALVITDIKLPGMSGLELLASIRLDWPEVAVIIMTAFSSISSAVEAMKLGAEDYIGKPFQLDELAITVEKALERRSLRREVRELRAEVRGRYNFSNIVGRSKPMQQLFEVIKRIAARRDASALITGSTGTGKELVARAIHYNSDRRDAPFMPINCSAIPDTLLESELFGYQKGAFTGAQETRRGLIEEAQGGTVFLDEINTLSPSLQVKLLRVLQERVVRRVGGRENLQIDIRLVSASNQDLEDAAKRGEFRQDLFYRLNVVPVRLPDLKDRREDIPLLVFHFLQKFAQQHGEPARRFTNDAMRVLMTHSWPGNVRELENAVEHALTMGKGEILLPEDLPQSVTAPERDIIQEATLDDVSLAELERRYILRILEKMGGHQIKTSRVLGIDRRTLYRRLRQYGQTDRLSDDDGEDLDEPLAEDTEQASASSG
ncbi:MAG TPA: sigma-54 dependent transcriptional regulator [Blastocatellia bacterium]|nr:sigma-54 dependent transcriptional regulator [Blastocatellia bacterium]